MSQINYVTKDTFEQMKAALAQWMDLKKETPVADIFGGRNEMTIGAGE